MRLGLANITIYNPPDPINYLANFLIQYRYNEIRNEEQQREFDELIEMRENLIENENSIDDMNATCGVERKISELQ